MTEQLFLQDAYLKEAPGVVTGITPENGIILDGSVFYATGGGQPGDIGHISFDGGKAQVVNTIKGQDGAIILVLAQGSNVPDLGAGITQHLNWQQRYNFMRIHTALHLLSVVIPLPVTGGQISAIKGRLDFDMPEAMENKQDVEDALNALIARDLEITEDWITDAELEANPQMVKTMSVKPPVGAGRVRLIRIGTTDEQIDLQPCGGTHVKRTSEIGPMRIGKVEKKSRLNRRVNIHFTD